MLSRRLDVAPLLDLSVVPAFGDTDADMTLGINGVAATSALSTQVIDSNLFQMKLGVSAQKDASRGLISGALLRQPRERHVDAHGRLRFLIAS